MEVNNNEQSRLERKIVDEFKKGSAFSGNDDPAIVLAKVFWQEAVIRMDTFEKQVMAKYINQSQDIERNIEKNIEKYLAKYLERQIKDFAYQLEQKYNEETKRRDEYITTSILNIKKASTMGWMITFFFFCLTLYFSIIYAPNARGADIGFRTTNYNKLSSVGVDGSYGTNFIAIAANYNKGITEEEYSFGGATAKLFPNSAFNFGVNYETASLKKITGESIGGHIGLKSSIFNLKFGSAFQALGDDPHSYVTTSIYDVTLNTLITQNFSIEPSFKQAHSDSDEKSSAFEIATLYKWTENFETTSGVGYMCGEKCEKPLSTLIGGKYTNKKMSLTLSSRAMPKTLLAPLATKVSEEKTEKMVSHQLKFSTNF